MTVSLRVVYRNSIMADGAPIIEFRRSDTNAKVSCVDCVNFGDDGKCSRQITFPWPLGSCCCSDWELRTSPHAMKKCLGCANQIPAYRTNTKYCDLLCAELHKLYPDKTPE